MGQSQHTSPDECLNRTEPQRFFQRSDVVEWNNLLRLAVAKVELVVVTEVRSLRYDESMKAGKAKTGGNDGSRCEWFSPENNKHNARFKCDGWEHSRRVWCVCGAQALGEYRNIYISSGPKPGLFSMHIAWRRRTHTIIRAVFIFSRLSKGEQFDQVFCV